MSYTPGPWTYQEPGWDGLPYLTSTNGEVVATFFSEPENSSDIQLIAAAPELYERLNDFLINIERVACGGENAVRFRAEWVEDAKAALAKARGEEGEDE